MIQGDGAESWGFKVTLNVVSCGDYRQTLGQMYCMIQMCGLKVFFFFNFCSFKCDLARYGGTQH